MNRLTLSILLSFTVVLTVTALNYTPDTPQVQTCKAGVACDKPDCCQKVTKACGPDCTKPAVQINQSSNAVLTALNPAVLKHNY